MRKVSPKSTRLTTRTTRPAIVSRPMAGRPRRSALEEPEVLREVVVELVVLLEEVGVLLGVEVMHERPLQLHRLGEPRLVHGLTARRAQLREHRGGRALRRE